VALRGGPLFRGQKRPKAYTLIIITQEIFVMRGRFSKYNQTEIGPPS